MARVALIFEITVIFSFLVTKCYNLENEEVASNSLYDNTHISASCFQISGQKVVAIINPIHSKCYIIEKTEHLPSQKQKLHKTKLSQKAKTKLTIDELKSLVGYKIFKYCKSYDSYLLQVVPKLENPFKQRTRHRRSNGNYLGRVRGQTQSQYLSFGNESTPGKAEAEATYGTSKAVVSGSNGIGSAQSQSSPGECGDCLYGKDSSVQSLYYGRGPYTATGDDSSGPRYNGVETPQSQRQRPGTADSQTVSGTFPQTDGARYPSGPSLSTQGQTFGQPQALYPTGYPSSGQQAGQSLPPQQISYHPGFPAQTQIGGQIPGLPQVSGASELPSQGQIPGQTQISTPTGLSSQGQVPGQSQSPYQPGGQITGQRPGQTQVQPPQSGFPPQGQFPGQQQSHYQPGLPIASQPTGKYPSQVQLPYQPGIIGTYESGPAERPLEGSHQGIPPGHYSPSATDQGYNVPSQIPGQYVQPQTSLTQDTAQQYRPQQGQAPIQQGVSTSGDRGRATWQGQSGQFDGQVSGNYHPGQGSGQFSGVFSGRYSHDQYGYSNPNIYGRTIGGYPGIHTYTPGTIDGSGQIDHGQIPSNLIAGQSGISDLPGQEGTFSGQTGTPYQQSRIPTGFTGQGITPTGSGNLPYSTPGIPGGQGGYIIQQPGQTGAPSSQRVQTGTSLGQAGYPSQVAAGFPSSAPSGYPGRQTAQPTASLPGYSNVGQANVPAGGQTGYFRGDPTTFPAGGQVGYPSGGQTSFPTGGQTGFPTGGQAGYPTEGQAGYSTGGQTGYPLTGTTGQTGYSTGGTTGQIGYPGQTSGSPGQAGFLSPGQISGQTGQGNGAGQTWQGSGYSQGTGGPSSYPGLPPAGAGGTGQFGEVPSELSAPSDKNEKDADSQAQAEVLHGNGTTDAKAQAQGLYAGGTAQSQVSGSYSGSGSFSALAGTIDGKRGAQTQVAGGKEGATSNAQGMGGAGLSQAQVQLESETGDTTSNAQSSGLYHGTNTQVQAGSKGGLADAQAAGPGSTSSQAQIGFTPHNEGNDNDTQNTPFRGGGTASAQSGSYAGQTQSQLQGKFRFGIRYTGAAQAGSGSKDSVISARNQTRPPNLSSVFSPFKPITYSSGSPSYEGKSQQQEGKNQLTVGTINEEKVVQRKTFKVHKQFEPSTTTSTTAETISEIITTTFNPLTVYNNNNRADDYNDEDYEDYDGEVQDNPHSGSVISQTGRTQRQNIILDPLEDLDANVIQSRGDPDLPVGTVLQPGQDIPGTYGYRIPTGFRGRVASAANNSNAFASGHNSQAQSVSLRPGTGKVVYKPPTYAIGFNTQLRNGGRLGIGSGYTYQPVGYQLRSGDNPPNFVSVTKSESGSRDIKTGAKKPSIFYTQSSTCGFFTNTCVLKGNRKICIPKPKINPDGSPVIC